MAHQMLPTPSIINAAGLKASSSLLLHSVNSQPSLEVLVFCSESGSCLHPLRASWGHTDKERDTIWGPHSLGVKSQLHYLPAVRQAITPLCASFSSLGNWDRWGQSLKVVGPCTLPAIEEVFDKKKKWSPFISGIIRSFYRRKEHSIPTSKHRLIDWWKLISVKISIQTLIAPPEPSRECNV